MLTLRTALPTPKYEKVAQREAFYERVLSGVRALPGVQSAGFTSFLPIVMRGGVWAVDIVQNQQRSENHTASMRFITPGYLAMGIPLKLGRGVEETDGATALPVAGQRVVRAALLAGTECDRTEFSDRLRNSHDCGARAT